MTPSEALLKAQEFVSAPKYNARKCEWVINYKKDGKKLQKSFFTEEGAYNFYYQKIREVKNNILGGHSRCK